MFTSRENHIVTLSFRAVTGLGGKFVVKAIVVDKPVTRSWRRATGSDVNKDARVLKSLQSRQT